MKNCILFRTYSFTGQARLNYSQYVPSAKDLFILYDCTDKERLSLDNAFNFDISDYLNLPYLKATPEIINMIPKPPQTSQIIYCNPEYAVLMFYKLKPDYDYYYSFEWDVWKGNRSNEFFEEMDARNDDLLGTYLQNLGPEWYWNTFNFPISNNKKRAMFGAIHRYSNKCLEMLDKEYSEGKYAWYETAVASLACLNDFKINDINIPGGKRWYSPETMRDASDYEFWANLQENEQFNYMFYHPVRVDFRNVEC